MSDAFWDFLPTHPIANIFFYLFEGQSSSYFSIHPNFTPVMAIRDPQLIVSHIYGT